MSEAPTDTAPTNAPRIDESETDGWHLRREERDGELVTVPVYHYRERDI